MSIVHNKSFIIILFFKIFSLLLAKFVINLVKHEIWWGGCEQWPPE